MIRLGGSKSDIQDQNAIFHCRNDWIRRIGIEYSLVGMIGFGGSELNIQWMDSSDDVDLNTLFSCRNDRIRQIRI